LASSALKVTHPTGDGAQPAASHAAPAAHAVADIIAITTQDDFLLELGAVLGTQAAVHRVESLALALEQMGASRRARILVFDTRGMADLRNSVGRAYARAPAAAIVLFAHAADEESLRRAFKGSKVFAVLPFPMDSAKTALVFADALTDALAKNRPAPARVAAAPSVPTASVTPRNDRWGLGAVVAVLVVACAWFIARDKEIAVPGASASKLSVPAAQATHPNGRVDAALAAPKAAQEKPGPASASQTAAAMSEAASPSPDGAEQPSLLQADLRLIHYVAPEYPAAARARNLAGSVVVAYTVDAQGATRHVRVVSAEPAGIFNHDAVNAVRRWRYAPVMVDNAAVAVATRTTIRFTPQ
jgi:TonB family protein